MELRCGFSLRCGPPTTWRWPTHVERCWVGSATCRSNKVSNADGEQYRQTKNAPWATFLVYTYGGRQRPPFEKTILQKNPLRQIVLYGHLLFRHTPSGYSEYIGTVLWMTDVYERDPGTPICGIFFASLIPPLQGDFIIICGRCIYEIKITQQSLLSRHLMGYNGKNED